MKIEYLAGMEPRVEEVTAPDLHRWSAEHPEAVILHATPDEPPDDVASGEARPGTAEDPPGSTEV